MFKFDGVRYIPYKSETQKSKSITGLTISSSGKLYCFNFQSQIFCLDNVLIPDARQNLKALNHNLSTISINSIASDLNGNIYVTHEGGISAYNEVQQKWKNYFDFLPDKVIQSKTLVSKSEKGNLKKNIRFIYSKGIAEIANNRMQIIHQTDLFHTASLANFEIENYNNVLWFFSKENDAIYLYNNNKIEQLTNTRLNEILANRKVTNVKSLPDGNLWICTYKGIVKYNVLKNKVELLYPELSFSDCIIDRENNYWLSTLQIGVLRVPNLSFSVWNKLENNHLVKITTDKTNVYFASVNGTIGVINSLTNELKTYHTGNDADVQSLDYDLTENTLYFNVNNRLYKLKNNKLTNTQPIVFAIKSYRKIDNTTFALSSQGIFINGEKVNSEWARALKYDEQNQIIWIATNKGLQQYTLKNNEWKYAQTVLYGTQILSIDFDESKKQIYALTFNGEIYNQYQKVICELPQNIQVQKLKFYRQKLFVASNKGIWIYNLQNKQWSNLNTLSGLVSENIQDLVVLNNTLWLATTKGIQKIPLDEINNVVPLAKIYLKNSDSFSKLKFQLSYQGNIMLNPETSNYYSNGSFQYAYRINKTGWIKLPASIEQIEIQNIPTGNVTIELKAIDHLGRDSENTITLSGYVNPPFYKTWWFTLLIIMVFFSLFFLIFKRRIKILNQKQQKEIERIQLENDLRISREKALKSQMNPHFVFNVLNSIKAYIYKNDKQNATEYLNGFSRLIRTFLSMSDQPLISLADELKLITLYIKMEAMQLADDFSYQQTIDEDIDLKQTKIPSLIIQPFIENAFKHGLHHKKGKKKLAINIKQEEGVIIIELTDNGIGRKASENFHQKEKLEYESFATKAIEKRIELINKEKNRVNFSIIDLQNNNIPMGTQVIIKISCYE